MTDDNHEFTTDSDNDRLADPFDQYRNDESSAHRWIAGQIGSGITSPKGGAESDDNDTGGNQ